jgi:hypothetical protein
MGISISPISTLIFSRSPSTRLAYDQAQYGLLPKYIGEFHVGSQRTHGTLGTPCLLVRRWKTRLMLETLGLKRQLTSL